MTKQEMLSDIAANDYSRLRNVHSDFLLLEARANNAERQFDLGLIDGPRYDTLVSQCKYAAAELVSKIFENPDEITEQEINEAANMYRVNSDYKGSAFDFTAGAEWAINRLGLNGVDKKLK